MNGINGNNYLTRIKIVIWKIPYISCTQSFGTFLRYLFSKNQKQNSADSNKHRIDIK
jgi:hypothetical protein